MYVKCFLKIVLKNWPLMPVLKPRIEKDLTPTNPVLCKSLWIMKKAHIIHLDLVPEKGFFFGLAEILVSHSVLKVEKYCGNKDAKLLSLLN